MFGLIVLGILLIGLDLSQRTWGQSDFSRLFRQSHRTNSIAYSRQEDFFREVPTLIKHAQNWYSRRKASTEGLNEGFKQVRRSQPQKLATDYIPPDSFQPMNPAAAQQRGNHAQKVNPAAAQRRGNHAQKVNPNFKQTYSRFSQPTKPISNHPELSPPQPNNRGFKQTIKPSRKTKLAEEYTELASSRPINPAFEETIKPPRKTKVVEKRTEINSPQSISFAFEDTVERPQQAESNNSQSGANIPQQIYSANAQTRIRSSRWSKQVNFRSDSTFSIDKSKDKSNWRKD